MHPFDRRRDIAPALNPVEQFQQVLFQVLAVVGPTLAIDSGRTVRFDSFIGCLQPLHIQIVVERCEHLLRSFSPYLRYPLLYRAHVF